MSRGTWGVSYLGVRSWLGNGQLGTVAAALALLLFFSGQPASAQEGSEDIEDLASLSLEELMNVEVTSVSKKAEKRSDAAAAIFVLTNEDIRRAGVNSIPEALRLVPGVAVAHIDQNIWSVSSRGFAGRFANKLLVLIDGRSVYTPNFSGVFWEFQDVMLEDVDRIEVIRGPGGTLWGANAVNGVINIVTKSSAETQGGLVVGGIGTEYGKGALRYGGQFSEDDFYRLYTRYWQRDEGHSPAGGDADDDANMLQGGFRMDFKVNERDSFTFQGDIFNQSKDQLQFLPSVPAVGFVPDVTDTDAEGFNVLGRWERQVSERSDLQLQFYHDYYTLRNPITKQSYHISDAEFQHRYRISDRNELIWGLGARMIQDDFEATPFLSYNDLHETTYIFSAFVQDEFAVTEDFVLTFGTKVEHNSYTGIEFQPSGRFRWNPRENQTIWGAVSRAVRTPSRAQDDIVLALEVNPPSPPLVPVPILVLYTGDSDVESEDLLSFELGYRITPNERWAIDVATFYNVYDNLVSVPELGLAGPHPALPITTPYASFITGTENDNEGEIYGGEMTVDYAPTDWLRLTAAYSFAEIIMDDDDFVEGTYPEQMAWGRVRMNPTAEVDLDLILRYMDRLPGNTDFAPVDDYLTMDARIAWRPRENLELSLVGRNLIEDERVEFRSTTIPIENTEVETSVYGQVMWKF